MRQRLISAAAGVSLGVVILFFYNTIIFNIVVALIIFTAVYEVLIATHYVADRLLFAICAVFAVSVPFFHVPSMKLVAAIVSFLFIFTLFVYLLVHHQKIRFELIGTVFLTTMLLSVSFSCLIFIRDNYEKVALDRGLFYICLMLFGAWMTDAGAYFIGVFFGKHKLAPGISPKKTIEGVVGGFVFSMISFYLATLVYGILCNYHHVVITPNYIVLTVASLLCSAAAIIGDLSASLIKRECNIKDFGNILPGHGGVLDRFDSVMFVAPLMYLLLQIFPILK
ncbi:MAG: phosphatidate cytidylyltransferase [Clostridia bacterium]|nr:phosphatidate cytidylyltransferase [Clostridia bacterium]